MCDDEKLSLNHKKTLPRDGQCSGPLKFYQNLSVIFQFSSLISLYATQENIRFSVSQVSFCWGFQDQNQNIEESWPRSSPSSTRAPKTDISRPGIKLGPPRWVTSTLAKEQFGMLILLLLSQLRKLLFAVLTLALGRSNHSAIDHIQNNQISSTRLDLIHKARSHPLG